MCKKWDCIAVRNTIAFWIFGLCNNYGYVVMLSAAVDILSVQQGDNESEPTNNCEEHITERHCTTISTGAVLVADCLPAFFVGLIFPFFMHRIPFVFRHVLVCILQTASYLMVAFSTNVPMSLVGVCFASIGCGLGEISCLALTSHYPTLALAAWSSGTGAAGLFGSFVYAFLTDKSMGKLKPKVALLIQLFIPILFVLAYFCILVVPKTVHRPGCNPKTWIVPSKASDARLQETETKSFKENEDGVEVAQAKGDVTFKKMTFIEKLRQIVPLLHLMVPLSLVYVAEYLINQGVNQLIIFNCYEGFNLTLGAQYRWYQVLYQLGVFISRSSIKILELPVWLIYLLPVFQTCNFVFFLFQAIYWFVPSIGIMFALIVIEGLLGGSSYVNTFNVIHKTVAADVREYCMAVANVGNSLGIAFAGFMSIPLHNFICRQPMPTVR
ncbi:unnamed protein product [Cylicocyclus nassatus]|uniref:Battenin n=1 Tax=Cylicocyclus nassatus TaxID=53992 RepID=A0AA36M2M6_CYLNA|nr:unnamed protein product [Cylicocyclus nassatus]